ncbi:hypothetical protein TMFC_230031 [Tenacibaculum maritimum]|uniref:hypothetical protein n=3 Tax=Tenacibaculum maritimum TaxID=107401 RepID=UPI0012E5A087|nr:hypothetical protein [Tenacibaculum maritimum]CAA0205343.1 hypothetical protein TMFC_230031 [Tenacibaculum maritimum]
MKSIFFICKPLEMLGAIEAREQLKLSAPILIIKSDKKDDKTIDFLIKKSGNWGEIIKTKKKSSYGISWLKLTQRLKKENYEYLFTRAFPIASYFVNNLNYNKLYLLDDGNATINIAKEFRDKKSLTKRFSLFKGKNKKGIKYDFVEKVYNLYNIKIEGIVDKVGFYTYYELPKFPNQIVLKNEFKWLKTLKKSSTPQSSNEIYIIGTDIAEANVLRQGDYLITLRKIADKYPNKKLIYIPHGREQKNRVEEIRKHINCEIRYNEFNVELDFMFRNEYPTHIVGTITTALITLKLIYQGDIRIDFYNFDDSKIIEDKRNDINEIYKYQKEYINFIELVY